MNEQCQFTCRGPLLREDPYRAPLTPELFYKSPGFRQELVVVPTGAEWSRIIADSSLINGCIVHLKERIYFKKKKQQTRRIVYEWFVGPLEKNQDVRTTCNTRGCIYPPHLKSRNTRSNRESVKEMLINKTLDKGLTQKQRALKYGLSIGTVQKTDQSKIYTNLIPINTTDAQNNEVLSFHFTPPPFMTNAKQ